MDYLKNWKQWYKESKVEVINSFGDFIKELYIGDMDLNTYAQYCYFVYQNKDALKKSYKKFKEDNKDKKEAQDMCERRFSLSIFAKVNENEKNLNATTEDGVA